MPGASARVCSGRATLDVCGPLSLFLAAMRARVRSLGSIGTGFWLAACAASAPARTTMPARTEIVVDEAEVVRVQAPGARGDRLPPLPRALDAMSPAFQRG